VLPERLKKRAAEMTRNKITTRLSDGDYEKLIFAFEHRANPHITTSFSDYIRKLLMLALHNTRL